MNLRAPNREIPDINLTPLIDVVFLLLIFFMVSTTFNRDAELSIELPEASAEPEKAPEKSIEISIDPQGRYYVNGKQLVNTQLATLKQALRSAASERKDVPLIISADAKTPHQSVITVMDAARQLGLVHLSFATRFEEEGSQ